MLKFETHDIVTIKDSIKKLRKMRERFSKILLEK